MIARSRQTLRRRLTRIIVFSSMIAVLISCIGSVAQDVIDERKELDMDLTSLSEMIAANSGAALTFGDKKIAQEVLSTLRARPSVVAGCIYTENGLPFAMYPPGKVPVVPRLERDASVLLRRNGHEELFRSIVVDGERVGTLYISSDRRNLNERMREDAAVTALILVVCLAVAFILSWRLQGQISGPIVELARVASDVSIHKNYSVRATPQMSRSDDEVGDLMTGFNSMLDEIEERDMMLIHAQTELVTTVELRTAELTVANLELVTAKNAAERVAEVNAQLARESALILNSATDGIMGLDLNRRVAFLNPAAARILGRSLDDFHGKSLHEAIHYSRADGTPWSEAECPFVQAMLRGESVVEADDTFWRPDGSSFPVSYSGTPMLDGHGNRLGVVVTFRDVTERRAIERLKSEFVSTVSHELRTPLTSIRGALGLLSSGMLGTVAEKGRRMLEIAVTNTDRLVRLINDILDLERIESGKVELARSAVDAHTIMVQASEGLQAIADAAGVRLVVQPVRAELWGDTDRIIQTLTNLIGNAIKFSPPNTTVTLSGKVRDEDFLFSVADQGRGVPEQNLESIFDRFSQVDASDSRDKGGSGLGLAICQSIVNAHGGRIWAEQNDPAGTRFQFTIPLAFPTTVALPAIDAASGGNAWRIVEAKTKGVETTDVVGPTILVVEDDFDLARVMTAALESRGMRTAHAVRGSDAIEFCRHQVPSLIVLDLVLSDMDGFEVVSALRENPTIRATPLLMYSALDVGSADQSRLRLGPTAFLTKSRSGLADFEAHVLRLLETAGEHAA